MQPLSATESHIVFCTQISVSERSQTVRSQPVRQMEWGLWLQQQWNSSLPQELLCVAGEHIPGRHAGHRQYHHHGDTRWHHHHSPCPRRRHLLRRNTFGGDGHCRGHRGTAGETLSCTPGSCPFRSCYQMGPWAITLLSLMLIYLSKAVSSTWPTHSPHKCLMCSTLVLYISRWCNVLKTSGHQTKKSEVPVQWFI